MNNSEYMEIMDDYYQDKQLDSYYTSIESICVDLKKEAFLEKFSIELNENIFEIAIKTCNSKKVMLDVLYAKIVEHKDNVPYSFLYHHPSELISKVKLHIYTN